MSGTENVGQRLPGGILKLGDDLLSHDNSTRGKYARGKYSRPTRRRHTPLVLVILLDILVGGLIILTFAFFHHVLPAIMTERARQEQLLQPTEPTVYVEETQPPVITTEPPETQVQEVTEPTEAPTEPDQRTEWQIKFAEHFSDEVIMTENSYKSPEVSITIETGKTTQDGHPVVYYVADIYVASIDNFVTRVANDDMSYYSTQNSDALDKAANAILSMCGDFMTYQKGGFMMRNGEIYVDDHNLNSICVLYRNGEMETFDGKSYKIDKIKEKDPVQVWSFGPALLDKDGKTRAKYTVSSTVAQRNPRSAVGYYEPGHYCFVVVDGRQKHSAGIKIPNLATIFEELGCKAAYNLDGGGSAVMMFDHKTYSKQSNGADRKLGDLLVIRDSYYGAKEVSE